MRISLKSLTDRVTAIFLFVLFMEISVAIALGISCMYDYHFYASDRDTYALQEAFRVKSEADIEHIFEYASLSAQPAQSLSATQKNKLHTYTVRYAPESTNIRFVVCGQDGQTLLTNLSAQQTDGEAYIYERFAENVDYDIQGSPTRTTMQFRICRSLSASDSYRFVSTLIRVAIAIRFPLIGLFVLSLIAALGIMGALMSAVEVTDEKGREKREYFIDRIPLDLLILILIFVFGFFGVLVALTAIADVRSTNIVLWNAIILIISFFLSVLALVFNLSVAARIKRGHVYRNTLIFRLIARIRKLSGKENDGYFKVPFIGKAMLTVGIAVVTELVVLLYFLYQYYTSETGLLSDFKFVWYVCFWAAGRFILIPVFFMMALNLNRLRESGEHLAEGDFAFDVESNIMFGDFRQINANLNKIRGEMMEAAEEKNRSYQLRSELITNISHDIKTPLTSIVNYVDLLEHSGADAEESAEYMQILKKQSVKLKKLLESLIEVSKLTTGEISAQMEQLDAVMFIEQTVSEFADRLEAARLDIVPTYAAPEMPIHADGDKLWRVFENLFENMLKYAQSGTRVYVDALKEEDRVRIVFKNISKDRLRQSGEELLHRFSRGDTSRHTEGYGLGLSIAQSLTEIQGGTLSVTADGDLFRVDLTFQSAEE